MDSLRSDVRERFAKLVSVIAVPVHRFLLIAVEKGVPIIEDEDQNSTDLMKCLATIEEVESSTPTQPQVLFFASLRLVPLPDLKQ